MRKLHVIGVALVALFAFGALTAVSASAITFLLAEWLWNGSPVTTELATNSEGELLLEDTETTVGKAAVLCSGVLHGWVGPNSLDWISEVLSLSNVAVNTTPLAASGLACSGQTGCGSSGTTVWAVNLGWETEVELGEDPSGQFFILLLPHAGGGNVGWEVECTIVGVKVVDECTTPEGVAQLSLDSTTLLANFSEAITELAGAKLANCSQSGGKETGIVEGGGEVKDTAGGELSASSESVEA
jgi:hypothetical protein